jgi:hypothetical protein
MTTGDDVDVAVAALQSRVVSLEEGIQRVAGAVNDLGKKIDAGQRTPWTVIWTALGVVVAFMGMFIVLLYKPVESNIAAIQSRLRDRGDHLESRVDLNAKEIGKLRESTVMHEELVAKLDAADRVARELRGFADERSRLNSARIDKLVADSVTKDEVAGQFAALEKSIEQWRNLRLQLETGRIDHLQQQVDEVRARLASIATPQDTIGELRKRLDELDKFLKEVALRQKNGG